MVERTPEAARTAHQIDPPNTLDLMRLLEQHPEYSQRQLSVALGVSVGKTHYLLKALVDKGQVKAKNFRNSSNKAGYLYVLTPAGVKQRWRLTQEFLMRKEKEYSNLRSQIASLREEVAAAGSTAAGDEIVARVDTRPASSSTGRSP